MLRAGCDFSVWLCYGLITIGGYDVSEEEFCKEKCYEKVFSILKFDENVKEGLDTLQNTCFRFQIADKDYSQCLNWMQKKLTVRKPKKQIERFQNSLLINDHFRALF